MARLHTQPMCVATALAVPLLSLAHPNWMTLSGVAPSWAVLWLLPWALVDGPWSGVMAGAALGLLLDGLGGDGLTQLPALILLGWWWGRLGRRGRLIQCSLNLGLLAWFGAMVVGLSCWLQLRLVQGLDAPLMQHWAWHLCLTQALITGLLAPMLVSWQVLLWRRRAPG
ncbi:MAG: rod shape-determining protein MreD [Synechococcus sp.]|nr:rod shape-determining protein MreD [Synechococcus sp.]